MAKVGLVTVLFKSDDVLDGFYKSISIQDHKEYVLYLVDNSFNDHTNTLLAKLDETYSLTAVRHINSGGNTGVAAGNNSGIMAAIADGCNYVILLNNDIEISQPFLISRMISMAEQDTLTMIVPKIFYYDTHKLWMAGGYMDNWRALGVHYGMNKPDAPAFNSPRYITYAPTCFMLIPASVFSLVGMMDEKYFAYYDDTDFVVRAAEKGVKLFYDPALEVLHKVSSSAGDNSPFYVYYSNRNKVYFIRKNMRGLRKYFALFYTLLSRVAFWLRFDKSKKKKLVLGLKDGFKMAVDK